jgi:chorismate-pyruvate lyase
LVKPQLRYGIAVVVALAVGLVAGLLLAPGESDKLDRNLRLYAVAQQARSTILASSSATSTLQAWCRDHRLAPDPKIVAQNDATANAPLTDAQRTDLQLAPTDQVRYRRVRLTCGDRLLSEAENWYVPDRLTPEMNDQLDRTTTPFGTVVQSLTPSRTTLRTTFDWQLLPADFAQEDISELRENAADASFDANRTVFSIEAVLRRASDRLPISLVRENYKQGLFAWLN